jgi:hypothetical protein
METEVFIVTFEDIVSKPEYCKFKIVFVNKTADYLLVKASEIVVSINGKEYKSVERNLLVRPNDRGSRVIDVKGTDMQYDEFSVIINGVNRFSAAGTPLAVPDFKLPATVNSFQAGAFNCTMIKIKKETDETAVKFDCIYNGDKIGVFYPAKTVVRLDNGTNQEFAMIKSDAKPILFLTKGQADDFTLSYFIEGKVADMQFANMSILWKESFTESALELLKTGQSIKISVDRGLTAGKNK